MKHTLSPPLAARRLRFSRPPRALLAAITGLGLAALFTQACGGKEAPVGGAPSRSASAVFQAVPSASGAYVVASGPGSAKGGVVPAGSSTPSAEDTKLLQAMEGAGGSSAAPATSGPQIGILSQQAQVYAGPSSREARIGYLRRGARTPSDGVLVQGPGCSEGWFKLSSYGYVCAKNATTEADSAKVRLGVVPANLTDILPYKYARNVHHGTPMYRHLPTRSEMLGYEPYLRKDGDPEPEAPPEKAAAAPSPAPTPAAVEAKPKTETKAKKKGKKKRKKKGKHDEAVEKIDDTPAPAPTAEVPPPLPPPTPSVVATDAPPLTLPLGAAGAAGDLADAGTLAVEDAGPPKPWWRRKLAEGEKPEIKLADLTEDADKLLVRRMVQGFYVAVDRTFSANNRLFHHTTQGLLAPADRMSLVKAPDLSGIEIDEAHAANAVGFVLAKTPTEFSFDEKGAIKPVGQKKRYDRSFLTGKTRTHGGGAFHETIDGTWLRDRDITWTEPGKPPADLAANEKWIDVNLTTGTLVAFEGTRAVFATLVSTGKKSTVKEKDHRTPTGTWRVREKHVAATMDGDGAAAGDLPYSIEDVPYIQYFFESYALHAAFWHDNFGRQQSHGCVNLAPLDAKRLFFWSDPPLPAGWHGVQSTAEHPGSRVVVHD